MINKIETLANFLEVSKEEAQNLIENESYLVLTDEEAQARAIEEIRESLWAFNADFILNHNERAAGLDFYEHEAAKKALENAQGRSYESLNGFIYAFIDDFDEFAEDAINADGRGHFISFYDGKEHETNNGLFIYKLD